MRLSHLSAAAVLVALVAAMFVSLGSVRAAQTVTVSFSNDTDGVVSDDSTVGVRVNVKGGTSGETVTIHYIRVNGELDGPGALTGATATIAADGTATWNHDATNHASIVIPAGTTPMTYTVSVNITIGDGTAKTYTADLTVGDPGKAVDSVEISFRKSHIATADAADGTRTCGAAPAHAGNTPTPDELAQDKSERTDDANAPANEKICLTATVKNSLGKTANDRDVKLLFITSEGGTWTGPGVTTATTVSSVPDDDREATYNFEVTATAAAKVTVEVDAGPAEGEIELTFTDDPQSLSISEASDVLARSGDAYVPYVKDTDTATDGDQTQEKVDKGIIFKVTAVDKAGNDVDLKAADITNPKITNADGTDVTKSFWDGTNPGNNDNNLKKDGSGNEVEVRVGTTDMKVAAGEYMVEVSLTAVADSKVTATFIVADTADDVMVSASATESDTIGDVITVTATVTDKDGNPVADGTDVDFDVSEDTGLAGIGKGHGEDDTVDTTGGKAMVKYAVVGAGSSVVSASAGGATGVIVIKSTAGAPQQAEPEPAEMEPSLTCLSHRSGFANWSDKCMGTNAETIFALVNSRGATALHLWNRTAWVRYSVVDGQEVPGSMNFSVGKGDLLYISN